MAAPVEGTQAEDAALTTDFGLMRSVAVMTDSRNDEIRDLLQGFISRMEAVPPSVWGGVAATRFKDVIQRWNVESMRLSQALMSIAETIRHNERELSEAAHLHAQRIGTASAGL